jgi:hypothetical protein
MPPAADAVVEELDPFELPDWLGEGLVTWVSDGGLAGHLVTGRLTGASDQLLPCDLLAVDEAYPAPVLDDVLRSRAHQAWHHGQVLLVARTGRPTLAAPGGSYDADTVLEAFTRLARAVGADPSRWSVRLSLG